jgi:uncharacterized protein
LSCPAYLIHKRKVYKCVLITINAKSILGNLNMVQIKELLVEMNPWWKAKTELDFKERDVYRQLQKFMPSKQIIALTGLRRVGKTTIMLKCAEDAINSGLDPKNIVYFSFDEFRECEIRSVLNEYAAMMEKDLAKGRYLFLLDEIQKVNSWADQLKGIYDTSGKNSKIIISGSESLFIKTRSKETLAGRIFEFKVEPLSFKEFLKFKGLELKPVGLYEKELARLLEEFTLTLGFPELLGVKDKEIIRKYTTEGIVEKIIYRDIPELFKVRDPSILASTVRIIMEEPGQIVEISGLASDLKVSRQVMSNYLSYLEQSFLIKKLYNFSKSRRKVERKLKKYYPTIVSPDILFRDDEMHRSKVFEWLLVTQSKSEFFWRDPYKHEVDMVLTNEKLLPVEVKYGKISTDGLLAFMRKFKADEGYIISPAKEEKIKIEEKTISVVPAYKFLLT